jgi:hypothetical protein
LVSELGYSMTLNLSTHNDPPAAGQEYIKRIRTECKFGSHKVFKYLRPNVIDHIATEQNIRTVIDYQISTGK